MGREAKRLLPKVHSQLKDLGNNIRLARLRRGLSAVLVSQRAGIARQTLSSIEQGSPKVSIGNYATVLFVLGLERDLGNLAREDELGRKLQDARLQPPVKS